MTKSTPTVQSWMTPMPASVGPRAKLGEAHELMRSLGVRHLPVVDGTRLVGVVSERDLHLVETLRGVDLDRLTIEDAMTPDPCTVSPRNRLEDAVHRMAERKIGSMIVVQGEEVVGILTAVDGLRAFAAMLRSGAAA
jgi:acetoin utilization protein AcuB